jgi:hypothetical protein
MTDQLKNLITQLLTGIGAYFVGRGWITTDLLTGTIIPGLVTLIGLGYSVYLSTRGAKVASVAAVPGTQVVLPASEAPLAATLPGNVTTK